MRDHLYDTLTALINLVTVIVVASNRQHLRRLLRRQTAAEIRERLARSRG